MAHIKFLLVFYFLLDTVISILSYDEKINGYIILLIFIHRSIAYVALPLAVMSRPNNVVTLYILRWKVLVTIFFFFIL